VIVTRLPACTLPEGTTLPCAGAWNGAHMMGTQVMPGWYVRESWHLGFFLLPLV